MITKYGAIFTWNDTSGQINVFRHACKKLTLSHKPFFHSASVIQHG